MCRFRDPSTRKSSQLIATILISYIASREKVVARVLVGSGGENRSRDQSQSLIEIKPRHARKLKISAQSRQCRFTDVSP
jgi:hypothetical protein